MPVNALVVPAGLAEIRAFCDVESFPRVEPGIEADYCFSGTAWAPHLMDNLPSTASPKLIEEMLDIVAREAMIERDKLALDTKLKELDIQSADFVMILMAVEEKFGTYISVDSEFSDAETVGDLVRIVSTRIAKAGKGASA